MARIHGKNGQVFMDPTGAIPGTFTAALGDLNNWTLDMSTALVEVTAFEDTNIRRVSGLPDYSGDLGGWWNSLTSPALFDTILAGLPVTLKLVPSKVEPTFFFSGRANIDGGLEVSATGAVTFTGSWSAADNWTMAP